ncbi:MAG: hypothetical protein HC938_01970 [Nitrospira sp.]|nr:hypothetical protein [Nitrospira sp.]
MFGLIMAWLTAAPVFADPQGSGSAAPVRLHGETLFTLQTGLANVDTASRATAIEKRLDRLARAAPSVIESLRVEDHEQTAYVLTSEEVLFVVTDNEAKAAGNRDTSWPRSKRKRYGKRSGWLPPSNHRENRRPR